ncbi:MAG: hypothetical protein WCG92_23780 [Hyphomicrobiales bacterium]|nr:hypothetical protein [Alphaproteobacteria bacterium]
MVRKFACIALLLVLPATGFAAPACDGDDDCAPPATSKPLDIKQFMREQAASTRGATPRAAKPRPTSSVATAKPPVRRTVAVRPEPVRPQAETTAFAPQDKRPVSPFPALTPRPETTGASPFEQNVQMVTEGELSDMDRRADQGALPAAVSCYAVASSNSDSATADPVNESLLIRPAEPQPSLLKRAWSGVAGTFVALSTAVHKLTGL